MNLSQFAANSIRLARVTHVSPQGQSFGCVYLDNGDFGRDVQLASPYAGSDFGFTSGVPGPDVEGYDENMSDDPDKRAVIAVIANVQGMPIALGFVYPQVSEMAFLEKGRMIERHTSDAYRTTNARGDMDTVHPSGAFLRIGAGEEPDTLKDFDGRWKIKRNTGGAVVASLVNPSGGGVSKVRLHPGGRVEVDGSVDVHVVSGPSDVRVSADGRVAVAGPTEVVVTSGTSSATLSPGGRITLEAAGEILLAAPVTRVAGALVLDGGRAISPHALTIASAVAVNVEAPEINEQASGAITQEAGGAITQKAPAVVTDAAAHHTTGTHTDSAGGHCPTCP